MVLQRPSNLPSCAGTYTIVTFPLYSYVSTEDTPQLEVALALAASAMHSIGFTLTPLRWACADDEWVAFPAANDSCLWEGTSAPPAYWLDGTLAPGQTLNLTVNPSANASLYPLPWYDDAGLYLRFVGAPLETGAPPALLTVQVDIGAEPSPSPSPSAVESSYASAAALPPGTFDAAGRVNLFQRTPLQMWVSPYALSFLRFALPAGRPAIRVNIVSRCSCGMGGPARLDAPSLPSCAPSLRVAPSHLSLPLARPLKHVTLRYE
jgi:hypothetical protein